MADPKEYRPKTGEIPTSPGVYKFRNEHGRVIYVGKAKNLRSRLTSYFADPAGLHRRTRTMVHTAAGVEWTVVGSEIEALQLEYTWIKEFDPRFNVKFTDDKSYPYLAVTMGNEVPRAQVMRGKKQKGTKYFGPYTQVWAIRETVDLLLRVFPIRTCSNGVFKRAQQSGRPCLLGYIGKCTAPCVNWISTDDHYRLAENFVDFMSGNTGRFLADLEKKMKAASAALDFEQAAKLRDDLSSLNKVLAKSAVVLPDSTDADIFAVADDELEASVQVFYVRSGRIRGQRGWIVEKSVEGDSQELIEQLLQQVYGDAEPASLPREVLVPELPTNVDEVAEWLGSRRGSRVRVRVPQRGDKKSLMGTVERNAQHGLVLHKTRRAGDLTSRSQALQEIQDTLNLPDAPLRIECFDISHTGGSNVVGSMVVFEDGLARKSEYRRFSINGDAARDDTASMYDVLSRRFQRYLEAEADAVADAEEGNENSRSPAKFAYPPNLLVVDGGPPQVSAAIRAISDLGVTDVQVCGLAKRLEEVWLPAEEFPVVFPRAGEGLYLLQRLRDEAHRFAISYHRSRRSSAMTRSELEAIPGLGETRQKALLKHFGSVKKIRAADVETLTEVPGVGKKLAETIKQALAADG